MKVERMYNESMCSPLVASVVLSRWLFLEYLLTRVLLSCQRWNDLGAEGCSRMRIPSPLCRPNLDRRPASIPSWQTACLGI